jgi:hypothetical protein
MAGDGRGPDPVLTAPGRLGHLDYSMFRTVPNCSTAFILGAGFSKCAGLPIQHEFSSLLLSDRFHSAIDPAITANIKGFLSYAFGWTEGRDIPSLEDIFTCIDLSAGSGHNLGIRFTPKKLRAIRRMAIHRIFSVLDLSFSYSADIETVISETFHRSGIPGFVVLNWDIVLEKHLARLTPVLTPDYACEAFDWATPDNVRVTAPVSPVCKMHGSSNWVYCENCKALFYDVDEKLSLTTKVGLIKADFRLFDEHFSDRVFDEALEVDPRSRRCPLCDFTVSSHIATFSYRKTFRTHAYASVWHAAEQMLAHATHWVFIGYSLPSADYELKHLLKVAQLSLAHKRRASKLKIDVVVKGDQARNDYEGFFGKNDIAYFDGGLASYVEHLRLSATTS